MANVKWDRLAADPVIRRELLVQIGGPDPRFFGEREREHRLRGLRAIEARDRDHAAKHWAAAKEASRAERLARLRALPGVVSVPSLERHRKRLNRRGWRTLGGGSYGTAYGKGLLVWKVSHGGKGHDDGARRYLADLVSGAIPKTPHAPRVKVLLVDDEGEFAALMERMDTTIYEAGGDTYSRANSTLDRARGWSRTGSLRGIGDIRFAAFARYLVRKYRNVYGEDLHGGNVMVARDGRLVITDPISGRSGAAPAAEL